jgi:hypothetical protein
MVKIIELTEEEKENFPTVASYNLNQIAIAVEKLMEDGQTRTQALTNLDIDLEQIQLQATGE